MNVQATDPDFELQSLGWKVFQDLCSTIVSEVLGQTAQVFLPSRDGGRDGAFRGVWSPTQRESLTGTFTVQCKFSRDGSPLTLAALTDELEKAKRLAAQGLASNYILITNHRLSGRTDEAVEAAFAAIPGINAVLAFGREWITQKIRESARLRMLVPRVYGLGDLSQILDGRAYDQATEILSSLGYDLAKFVITAAHSRSAQALVKHGFVLLLGEPAAGKSTIAASLALGAIDLWDSSTLKIRSADEFVEHWNPHEPKQFFWVDDAFGPTQYQRELVQDWNRTFPYMLAAIRKGTRILFTSRDYIYRAAKRDLKVGAFPLVDESQVVINVQDLSLDEREQILYNHIRLGHQPHQFRAAVKPFLPAVAQRRRFLPEIARRLGDPLFTQGLSVDRDSVIKFVDEPLRFLVEVVANLDGPSRTALALVFMRGGTLESPITLTDGETKALGFFGATLQEAKEALNALNGSFVVFVKSGGKNIWMFKHPTISDAYASLVADDPELLDFYLAWTRIEKLTREVTCGDVSLEGVRVIVPESRYQQFALRLRELQHAKDLISFLVSRCGDDFLRFYMDFDDKLGELVSRIGSPLSLSRPVALLERLQDLGLLPEAWRLRFVETATEIALETPDSDVFAVDEVRNLFRPDELRRLRDQVRSELIPNLDSFVEGLRETCDEDDDPDEWFGSLRDVVDVLEKEFADDATSLTLLERVDNSISYSVAALNEERWRPEPDDDYDGRSSGGSRPTTRSVFDDVDD